MVDFLIGVWLEEVTQARQQGPMFGSSIAPEADFPHSWEVSFNSLLAPVMAAT
jgi:hypothetical protein